MKLHVIIEKDEAGYYVAERGAGPSRLPVFKAEPLPMKPSQTPFQGSYRRMA